MNLLVKNAVAGQLLSDAIDAINKQVALFEWEKTNKTGRYAKLFVTYERDLNTAIEVLLFVKQDYEKIIKNIAFVDHVSFEVEDFDYFDRIKSDQFFSNWEMRCYAGRAPTFAVSDASCA